VRATVGRQLRSAAGWVLVAVIVFLAWPAQLGGHLSLVVVSGHSMDGTYRSGDLLLTWPHTDYDVGDIVVYKVPKGEPASGLRVVHRIIDKHDGQFTSQGDNRDTPDFWRPTVNDAVGQPFLRVRAGGLVMKWLLSPIALALLCAGCVYLTVLGKDKDSDEGEAGKSKPGKSKRRKSEPTGDARPVDEAVPSQPPARVVSLVVCQTITPDGGTGSAR
jgi:signal peptidase I